MYNRSTIFFLEFQLESSFLHSAFIHLLHVRLHAKCLSITLCIDIVESIQRYREILLDMRLSLLLFELILVLVQTLQ